MFFSNPSTMAEVPPPAPYRSEVAVDVTDSFDSAEGFSSSPIYRNTPTEHSTQPTSALNGVNNSRSSSTADYQETEHLKGDLEEEHSTDTSSVSPSPNSEKSSLESSHNSQTNKMASAYPGHSHGLHAYERSYEINSEERDHRWARTTSSQEDSKLQSGKLQTGQSSNFTTSNTATSYGTSRQTVDQGCKLTVKGKSKVDRELSKKQIQDIKPSKLVVIFKWISTFLIGSIALACLIGSRVSFVSIAVRLRLPGNDEVSIPNNTYAFTMVTMLLLIPNVFNLLRSLWMGLSRKDMPWPSKRSIIWIVATSVVESLGVCLFAFKIFSLQFGVASLIMAGAVYIGPMVYLIYRRDRCDTPRSVAIGCGMGIILLILAVIVAMWRGFTSNSLDARNFWHLPVAVLCITVTWIPKVQKRLISLSSASGWSSTKSMSNSQDDVEDIEKLESNMESGRFQASQRLDNLIENKQNVVVSMKTQSFWKSAIIMSGCRIPAIILFSVLLYFFDTDKTFTGGALESFRTSWDYITTDSTAFNMFIINMISTLLGYFVSLVACRINMQRGAFVLPLVFSTPGVMAVVSGYCSSGDLFTVGDTDLVSCDSSEVIYTAVSSGLLLLAVCLSFGWVIWTTDTVIMCSESEVFWSGVYPGLMLHEWLLVTRRNKVTERREAPRRVAQKTTVYICTTMYRETREEMEQLLKSIGRVKDAQAHSDKFFESHVFFDGGVKEKTPTDFALQLISLLPETLDVETLMCTRTITAYGMKLSWKLFAPGERHKSPGMVFTIHLKDNRKVKNKKRWSQIMYMSYVLDFLVKQKVDALGNQEVDDCNAFILTTDADVNFTPDSVEALLDLMTRDQSVGAVCARTHPIGFGPLVWYQKFEYAIGHWFQKAAEDVLGSVLCAPGCFSVYRVSAVRDIVSTYASNVEKAFEFLTKDMGEDRWFCTLLVQSGWRIEYCAASENKTQCPEEFEEFYKQRRRWIASTIANLMLLVREWKIISKFNQRVSIFFTIYQGLLLFSTLIGPSVVILVVSGGLVYAWEVSSVTTILLQCFTCVGFTIVCLYFSQTTQMKVAKLLTFLYACVMMAVAVGTAQQVVQDLNYGDETSIINPANDTSGDEVVTKSPSDVSVDLPVSLTTLYLGSLIGIFFTAGVLHLREFTCLIHGFWYLMCLPSGYLILNIYSVCNITDRSWGTREEKAKSVVKDTRPWYEIAGETIQKIFTCCQRVEQTPPSEPGVAAARARHSSVTDSHPKLTENFRDSKSFTDERDGHADADVKSSVPVEMLKEADENYFEDEVTPERVEEWLDKDFRDYVPLFKRHGFDSTLFISAMKEKDLTTIGIKRKAHVTYLMERISVLPEFRIEVKVPENVLEWLQEIGLEQYYGAFKSNKITAPKDLEILKSFSRKEIESELKIIKAGHVARLLNAIKHLRNPTEEELKRIDVKKDLGKTECYEIERINPDEHIFWKDLTDACLKPGSMAFGHNEDLKEKLEELRNNFLGILAVANTLWLILLATLASKMELKVSGTDPVGLVFLAIFGFLLVLQFLCMLVHRLTTFGHFCARAPYRFGKQYNSSWKFADHGFGWSLSDEDRQALNQAKEGDKKIKARLVSRKRNQKKNVSIMDEKEHLLKDHNQTSYL
ncbi:uncharacterized protein LOC117315086 isoform X2 [Pecten maximus]|uniref:uncharacterized protein LOC117315086 isoform X2 n=1 Tax=Pecten maximus TaxID=6579 RepID=UPI0014588D7E|nr:uncharacterized protein LOC117315086 isoform X2 [Pecten maximus]